MGRSGLITTPTLSSARILDDKGPLLTKLQLAKLHVFGSVPIDPVRSSSQWDLSNDAHNDTQFSDHYCTMCDASLVGTYSNGKRLQYIAAATGTCSDGSLE